MWKDRVEGESGGSDVESDVKDSREEEMEEDEEDEDDDEDDWVCFSRKNGVMRLDLVVKFAYRPAAPACPGDE